MNVRVFGFDDAIELPLGTTAEDISLLVGMEIVRQGCGG